MTRATWATLTTAFASLFAQACSNASDGTSPDAGPKRESGAIARTYAPTLTAIQHEILNRQCAQPFCHQGAVVGPFLDTKDQSFQELVGVPASGMKCGDAGINRVEPGHPETSLLYLKIQNPSPPGLCGDPMPNGQMPLGDRDIAQIGQWITQGAMNN